MWDKTTEIAYLTSVRLHNFGSTATKHTMKRRKCQDLMAHNGINTTVWQSSNISSIFVLNKSETTRHCRKTLQTEVVTLTQKSLRNICQQAIIGSLVVARLKSAPPKTLSYEVFQNYHRFQNKY